MTGWVTIFADASYCDRTKASGWGCWIKGDGPAVVEGDAFALPMPSNMAAEACALANALHLAVRRGMVMRESTVMLQTDCAGVLSFVLKAVPSAKDKPLLPTVGGKKAAKKVVRCQPSKTLPRDPTTLKAVEIIANLQKEHGFALVTRHVRGHQGGGGRNWVNRQCDQIARRHQRQMKAQTEQKACHAP